MGERERLPVSTSYTVLGALWSGFKRALPPTFTILFAWWWIPLAFPTAGPWTAWSLIAALAYFEGYKANIRVMDAKELLEERLDRAVRRITLLEDRESKRLRDAERVTLVAAKRTAPERDE